MSHPRGKDHWAWKGGLFKACALPGCGNELTRVQILKNMLYCSRVCGCDARRGVGHPLWKGELSKVCALPGCENELTRQRILQGCRFCSHPCSANARRGPAHHNWGGGKPYRPSSRVWIPGRGHVFVSRIVLEKELGRRLTAEEVVHHIDGDPGNNELENLRLFSSTGEHSRFHMRTHEEECIA